MSGKSLGSNFKALFFAYFGLESILKRTFLKKITSKCKKKCESDTTYTKKHYLWSELG